MKIVSICICLIIVVMGISCSVIDEIFSDDDEDCISHCDHFKPDKGTVHIEVTINELNPEVLVEIYSGDIEEKKLIQTISTTEENLRLELKNASYAVRVMYRAVVDDEIVTVYSLDGDVLSADSYTECGDTCYDEGNIRLDVTLVDLAEVNSNHTRKSREESLVAYM